MNVLVNCEYSGIVRDAFADKGHHAISCDLLPTESPGHHFQGDAMEALYLMNWDLIIMHPPCTALCVSGNGWYGKGRVYYFKRLQSIKWTQNLWNKACEVCDHVCMENPVGVLNKMGSFPKPQYIQPWEYGHGETKKTGLWLHGLPYLKPTNVVEGRENRIANMGPSDDRGKLRSLTYPGIAEAMAEQWSTLTTPTKQMTLWN